MSSEEQPKILSQPEEVVVQPEVVSDVPATPAAPRDRKSKRGARTEGFEEPKFDSLEQIPPEWKSRLLEGMYLSMIERGHLDRAGLAKQLKNVKLGGLNGLIGFSAQPGSLTESMIQNKVAMIEEGVIKLHHRFAGKFPATYEEAVAYQGEAVTETPSVEPGDEEVVAEKPKIEKVEKEGNAWDALRKMDQQARLESMQAIYEYLQLWAPVPGSVKAATDNWYLNEDVLKTFPPKAREVVLANPELVGFKGEPGTFGGLFIALNLAEKSDREEGFKDHIKLVSQFRNTEVHFSRALELVRKSLDNYRKSALAKLIAEVYDDARVPRNKNKEDRGEQADVRGERREAKQKSQNLKEGSAKASNAALLKKERQAASLRRPPRAAGESSTGERGEKGRAEASEESGIDRLGEIDFEIKRLQDQLKAEPSVTREIALARAQHDRAETKYDADLQAAGANLEKRVQSLVDYSNENLQIAFRLEAVRARAEGEGNPAMVKAMDKDILNQQYAIFVDALGDLDKALKLKELRPESVKKLEEVKRSITGSLQQYAIESSDAKVLPRPEAVRAVPALPSEGIKLRLETSSATAALDQLPARRFEAAREVLVELLDRPASGEVAETATTAAAAATELSKLLGALQQLQKEGLKIDLPKAELAALTLVTRKKELPLDRKPLQETLKKLEQVVKSYAA